MSMTLPFERGLETSCKVVITQRQLLYIFGSKDGMGHHHYFVGEYMTHVDANEPWRCSKSVDVAMEGQASSSSPQPSTRQRPIWGNPEIMPDQEDQGDPGTLNRVLTIFHARHPRRRRMARSHRQVRTSIDFENM
jgi:hypothetical protein